MHTCTTQSTPPTLRHSNIRRRSMRGRIRPSWIARVRLARVALEVCGRDRTAPRLHGRVVHCDGLRMPRLTAAPHSRSAQPASAIGNYESVIVARSIAKRTTLRIRIERDPTNRNDSMRHHESPFFTGDCLYARQRRVVLLIDFPVTSPTSSEFMPSRHDQPCRAANIGAWNNFISEETPDNAAFQFFIGQHRTACIRSIR